MINFTEMFEDNYQYYLKNINYNAITVDPIKGKIDMRLNDEMGFELDNERRTLKLEVKRTVAFSPNVLYELTVSFGAILSIRDGVTGIENVDWEREFKENAICVNLAQGLLSRISMQISQITSSYGQNPVVTPPNFVN